MIKLGENDEGEFYIDDGVVKLLDATINNECGISEIPWEVIHNAIEWQKSRPLEQRKEIHRCPKCNEFIHCAQMERHIKAHG